MKIKIVMLFAFLTGCGPIHMDASVSIGEGIVTERRSAVQGNGDDTLVDRIATSLLDDAEEQRLQKQAVK
jgi:hypothetical protein